MALTMFWAGLMEEFSDVVRFVKCTGPNHYQEHQAGDPSWHYVGEGRGSYTTVEKSVYIGPVGESMAEPLQQAEPQQTQPLSAMGAQACSKVAEELPKFSSCKAEGGRMARTCVGGIDYLQSLRRDIRPFECVVWVIVLLLFTGALCLVISIVADAASLGNGRTGLQQGRRGAPQVQLVVRQKADGWPGHAWEGGVLSLQRSLSDHGVAEFECGGNQTTWPKIQEDWCCNHRGLGCPSFDCHAELSTYEVAWSEGKRGWCCLHEGLGCGTGSSAMARPPDAARAKGSRSVQLEGKEELRHKVSLRGATAGGGDASVFFAWLVVALILGLGCSTALAAACASGTWLCGRLRASSSRLLGRHCNEAPPDAEAAAGLLTAEPARRLAPSGQPASLQDAIAPASLGWRPWAAPAASARPMPMGPRGAATAPIDVSRETGEVQPLVPPSPSGTVSLLSSVEALQLFVSGRPWRIALRGLGVDRPFSAFL
eukprot:CAMPEP_0204247030 /NCGR_PEP_ID=MMETSP0361-20130328/98442_1 /ASSEMBLY_ACC=CAM_ASM_000343 /TAXON_ID=268821 /ORGANISM="Scrippsiella Hangoei, Strain SHTV-5" /LENGTH=483 /DNA_ID=CAMNT_0051220259 /DNA_START=25 /DNA_END=1473 /DNA_ORIENTATION=-